MRSHARDCGRPVAVAGGRRRRRWHGYTYPLEGPIGLRLALKAFRSTVACHLSPLFLAVHAWSASEHESVPFRRSSETTAASQLAATVGVRLLEWTRVAHQAVAPDTARCVLACGVLSRRFVSLRTASCVCWVWLSGDCRYDLFVVVCRRMRSACRPHGGAKALTLLFR